MLIRFAAPVHENGSVLGFRRSDGPAKASRMRTYRHGFRQLQRLSKTKHLIHDQSTGFSIEGMTAGKGMDILKEGSRAVSQLLQIDVLQFPDQLLASSQTGKHLKTDHHAYKHVGPAHIRVRPVFRAWSQRIHKLLDVDFILQMKA